MNDVRSFVFRVISTNLQRAAIKLKSAERGPQRFPERKCLAGLVLQVQVGSRFGDIDVGLVVWKTFVNPTMESSGTLTGRSYIEEIVDHANKQVIRMVQEF